MTNKNKIPDIRFKGFTNDWEEKKIGSLGEIITGSTPQTNDKSNYNGNYLFVSPADIQNNRYIKRTITTLSEKGFNKSRILEKDSTLFVSIGSTIGKIAQLKERATTNQQINAIISNSEYDNNFIFSLIENKSTKIKKLAATQAVPIINKSNFCNIDVTTSLDKTEQSKIGSYFQELDKLISQKQAKYEKLQKLKKAMLEKMFPKNGSDVPEIRFKGFDGSWERKKLGEVGTTQSGIGFPDKEQEGKRGIPFFKVSDMNNIGNEHIMTNSNNYVTNEQISRMSWKLINQVPAIIFAKVGAAIMLNRKRLVHSPFLIDNNSMAYIFDHTWNKNFGKIVFETINLPKYAQTGALPSYNGSDIENILISRPTNGINEQAKIGNYFRNLEKLITLNQKELEKLKTIKKACLEKMFV